MAATPATPVTANRASAGTDGYVKFSWSYTDSNEVNVVDYGYINFYDPASGTRVGGQSFNPIPGQTSAYIYMPTVFTNSNGTQGPLTPGKQYKYTIQVQKIYGDSTTQTPLSAESNQSTFTTLSGTFLPSIDISGSDWYSTDSSKIDTNPNQAVTLKVTWTPNSTRVSDPLESLDIVYSTGGTPTPTLLNVVPTSAGGNVYTYAFAGSNFPRNTGASIRVRAHETAGDTYSAEKSYGFNVAANPTIAITQLDNFDPGVANSLSWTYTDTNYLAGAQSSYVVSYKKTTDSSWTQLASGASSPTRSVTLPKLTIDDRVQYQYKVDVVGANGGTTSATAVINSKLTYRPQTVTLGAVTSFNAFTSKTFNWTYTANNYADPQTNYRVVITNSLTNVIEYDSGLLTGTASSITVPSGTLHNATDYTWAVTTTNTRWAEQVDVPAHYQNSQPVDMGLSWEDGSWVLQSGGGSITPQYTGKKRTGTYSLRLVSPTGTNTSKATAYRSISNLIVGTTYTWTTYATRNGTTGGDFASGLMSVLGDSGTPTTVFGPSNNGGYTWYQGTYTFTASATTATLIITSALTYSGGTSDTVWDDMVLTQNPYPVYIPDTYKTSPTPVTSSAAMHTQMPPNSPVVTHRTDFIASNVQTFAWTFSDRDDNDSQSAYQVQIQSQDGMSVLVDTGKTFGSVGAYTLPANTLAGGLPYRWHVYNWDQQDQQSPASTWDNFSTAAPVTTTITAPADGASLDTNYVDVTWTFATIGGATQQSYRVKVINENNQTITVDSGTVTSTALTYRATGIASNVPYRIEVVTTSSASVSSNTAIVHFTSLYNNPMKPVAVVTPTAAYITISATNPAVSGSRPATTYNELWRARGDSNAYQFITRLALGASYKDYLTAAGTVYNYFVRAYAANGNYLDSTPVAGNTKNQLGIVLFDPANPDSFTHQYQYGNIGRQESISVATTSRTYVTGIHPEYLFSGNATKQVSMSLMLPYGDTYADDLASIQNLVRSRKVIVYKDNRGRFLTGVITSITIKDEAFGSTVTGNFNQTTYTTLRI